MKRFFGLHHFKIKSFDPYAVGLSQNQQPGYSIEVRLSCFQVFCIPVFPLGKKWALRKDSDDRLYEMPEPYMFVLRERKDLHVATPLYAYTGSLAALSIIIIILLW